MTVRGFSRLILTATMILGLSVLGVGAQKKKKRTRRTSKPVAVRPVITNPQIVPPTTTEGDVKIISTADQGEQETSTDKSPTTKPKSSATSEQKDDMQQTITT